MKRFLIAVIALMMMAPMALRSQNVVTVHLKEGTPLYLAFKYEPVVTFTDSTIVLTTKVEGRTLSVSYPLDKLVKFTFDTQNLNPTTPTEVEGIQEKKLIFSFDDYLVNISGAKANADVRLIASNGKQLNAYRTDSEGSAQFSIADLPAGTYIVNVDGITFKIMKK